MTELLINDCERICKEAAVASFRYAFDVYLDELRKNRENPEYILSRPRFDPGHFKIRFKSFTLCRFVFCRNLFRSRAFWNVNTMVLKLNNKHCNNLFLS